MKTATFLVLALSLSLMILSVQIVSKPFLYIAVFGLSVSFLCILDIFVIQPREKQKQKF